MKLKKILAATMAAVLAVTMVPATAKANTIEGGGVYVDTEVYRVVLPTTASMKFYLDPQGLTTLDKDTKQPGNSAGTVVANISGMSAVNKSSVPVGLKVSYAAVVSGSGITVKDSVSDPAADVQNQTSNTVAISVKASADTTGDYKNGKAWKAASATDTINVTSAAAITADTVYAGASGAEEAVYLMSAADYEMNYNGTTEDDKYDSSKYSYVYKKDTGSELKLEIGGYCSKTTDWSALVKGDVNLSLEAVFTFVKTQTAGNNVTLQSTAVDIPNMPTSDGTVDLVFAYTGEWKAGSVTITSQGGETIIPQSKHFSDTGFKLDQNAKKFTITKGMITTWKSLGGKWGSGVYTVTLNGVETQFNIE